MIKKKDTKTQNCITLLKNLMIILLFLQKKFKKNTSQIGIERYPNVDKSNRSPTKNERKTPFNCSKKSPIDKKHRINLKNEKTTKV